MKKYIFRKYSKISPKLYRKKKIKIKKILPKARIEHIGSTAVPKLGGKGIIDILIGVAKKNILKTKKKLQILGYTLPKGGSKNRIFFEKDCKINGKKQRFHLHLTPYNSQVWRKALALRNYLIKNKQEAKNYIKIKKEAVKIANGEGKLYREYKKRFLDNLNKKAMKSK